ncbi:MAG: hypothetical protein J6N18_07735, partial [Kiritimatiellae bacterium]|nr:hypothetical protein [Kiritimatiellia bacterium]
AAVSFSTGVPTSSITPCVSAAATTPICTHPSNMWQQPATVKTTSKLSSPVSTAGSWTWKFPAAWLFPLRNI